MKYRFRIACVVVTVLLCGDSHRLLAEQRPSNGVRRPIGLVVADGWLYVANRDSGSISIIDTRNRRVVDEVPIGKQLSHLATVPYSKLLLATDFESHQLVLLKRNGRRLYVVQRLPVAKYPVNVCIANNGKTCCVASLWSRRLSVCEIRSDADQPTTRVRLKQSIDLPFAPRVQFVIPKSSKVIVADSFGGRLAIVDLGQQPIKVIYKTLDGHNIRGLAASHDGESIYLTHQVLNSRTPTTHEGVFWGGVIKNVIRIIPKEDFLSDAASEIRSATYPLSKPTDGTGDPANVLVTSQGRTLISLSGVNRIAVRPRAIEPFSSRVVGRRPTALAEDHSNRIAYIANTLDDSISVFDLSSLRLVDEIKLGLPVQLSLAQRGEQHFHDARLSLDGWYSCHSCHTDGHTNGLLNDNFGDGTYATPKRILSLLGTGETAPWAWNGSASSFGDQIKRSIHVTMQGENSSGDKVPAIAAYLATLNAPPSISDCRDSRDAASVERGGAVFRRLECARCHRSPFYTTPSTYNVGLSDEKGAKQFNPPSLRGVSQRGSYFHDNRARRLRDVFIRFGHGLSDDLSKEQLRDLLQFLNSL